MKGTSRNRCKGNGDFDRDQIGTNNKSIVNLNKNANFIIFFIHLLLPLISLSWRSQQTHLTKPLTNNNLLLIIQIHQNQIHNSHLLNHHQQFP
ncbi:hypothetical protein QVD17_21221 [Tagetes erecta]|uniref:Uncharacterized protein n=1 Tax=Tagetes erecta TaxID=13708 RepID=A0AAD8KU77_TARER|nr:hypothetical protein QVD17_21221 [Tagetes erecta]